MTETVPIEKLTINDYFYDRNEIDIVFSVLVHESPECIIDMLVNFALYNSNHRIKVILHPNKEMYDVLAKMMFPDWVILYPNPTVKRRFTQDILRSHIETYMYLHDLNVKFKYFCLMASNCMFVKQLDLHELVSDLSSELNIDCDGAYYEREDKWHWIRYKMNKELIALFTDHGITPVCGLIEGSIYANKIFQEIANYLIVNKVFEKIVVEFPLEEIVLQSIENKLCSRMNPVICKWVDNFEKSNLQDVKKACTDIYDKLNTRHKSSIKRIPRIFDHSHRVYIRNQMIKDLRELKIKIPGWYSIVYDDIKIIPYFDSEGGDIEKITIQNEISQSNFLGIYKTLTVKNNSIIALNSNGWVKSSILPLPQWNYSPKVITIVKSTNLS